MTTQYTLPELPDDLKKVKTIDDGVILTRGGRWDEDFVDSDGSGYSWVELLSEHGGVEDLREGVDEAIAFFGDNPAASYGKEAAKHIKALVRYAKEDS